ncbi:MAG: hypothetical protein MRJ93_14090 [Nitrososphaeraceae archaeon]|nr:hypothetical protein [Nitrososphaeraceae archaeon]
MTQDKDLHREEELNENMYSDHFDDISNLKRIIYESQQTIDQSNDDIIKEVSSRTIKTAKKYLQDLENETEQVTKQYEWTKRKLESFK